MPVLCVGAQVGAVPELTFVDLPSIRVSEE